jgi:hypothetical protein
MTKHGAVQLPADLWHQRAPIAIAGYHKRRFRTEKECPPEWWELSEAPDAG